MIGQTLTAVFKPNDNVRPAGVNFRPDRSLEQLYIATFRPKPRELWKNAVAPLQEEESFTPQALLEALIWTYIRTAILSKDDVPWTAPHHMITIESTELIREELRKHPKVKFDAVARKASEAQLEYVYFLTNDLISAARDLSIDLHLILVGHLSNHEGESSHLQTGWSKALKSNIQETCSEALLLLGLLTARAIKHQWSTVAEEVLSRGTIGSNRNFVVATSPVLFELEENESKVLRACLPAARAELNEGLQTSARRVRKNRAMRRRADEDADEEMEDPGAVDEEQDSESEQPGRKAELTVDQEFMTSNMDSEAEDEFESDNEEVNNEEVDNEESYEPLHEESPD
ncbi:unnamed protein product [Zymoseptoria tritici ST99CH_1A5]|uniref:Uncharacterized protein n=1 Tax=Zymoseptoria tritici ST99CH_1A5 TaxID=1276529 RepID=A0A1Y6LY88_ZYMTR|nr:unnamed protein product [Zymoseptoria tritici ST99CH_1A5]